MLLSLPMANFSSSAQSGLKSAIKETSPIICSSTRMTIIRVRVSDKNGKKTTDLRRTDFTIYENGGKTTIQAQEPVNKPKIKDTQLFPETGTGTLPVELELIPEEAQAQDLTNANASRGDSSPKIHFRIKNNSAKTITAYQVHIHADTGIEGSKPVVNYVKDLAPHPDIREYDQIQPLLPGASVTYGPRGVKLDEPDKKIQTLRLKLDFVVYEDGTFVSSVKDGAEAVLSRRRGAEIFKQLAVKVYNENNKSADKLDEWLREIKPYKDMVFEGEHDIQSYQVFGANTYRNFLERLYHVDRIALNKYLTEVK
jgi:hypothetical protein